MTDPKEAEILPDHQDAEEAKQVESEAPLPLGGDGGSSAVSRPDEHVPAELIALPLNQRPVFPKMMLPLVIPAGRLADAVRHAIAHTGGWIGFFLTRQALDNGAAFRAEDLYAMGCAARVVKHHEVEGGALQVFTQVASRFSFDGVRMAEPVLMVTGTAIRSPVDPTDTTVRAMAMAIVTALKDLVQHNPVFSDEIKLVLANFNNIDGPSRLADMAASLTTATRGELQQILEDRADHPAHGAGAAAAGQGGAALAAQEPHPAPDRGEGLGAPAEVLPHRAAQDHQGGAGAGDR